MAGKLCLKLCKFPSMAGEELNTLPWRSSSIGVYPSI